MGFEIYIQSDLSEKEYKNAVANANVFIKETLKNKGKFILGSNGGWHSYLKRGAFGRLYKYPEGFALTFRRYQTKLKNGNTVFCIVRPDTLQLKENGKPVNLKRCMCPKHLGGEKVKWVNSTPPDTTTYCVINYTYPIE